MYNKKGRLSFEKQNYLFLYRALLGNTKNFKKFKILLSIIVKKSKSEILNDRIIEKKGYEHVKKIILYIIYISKYIFRTKLLFFI